MEPNPEKYITRMIRKSRNAKFPSIHLPNYLCHGEICSKYTILPKMYQLQVTN